MRQTSSDNTPHARSGGVRAGRDLKADNIVTGVQIQGADAESAQALLTLARDMNSGGVEAVRDLIAKNVVTGFQYIGQAGTAPSQEQFQQELTTLREQLAQAVQAGEIADTYDAADAQTAIDRAIEQTQAPQPLAEKIAPHLERTATIIDKAATVATSAEKFQAAVIKLAPVATALKHLVGWLF